MSSPSIGTGNAEPFLVYANFSQKIKMSYPRSWRTQEQTDPAGFVAMFVSPPEGPSDPFFENLNIIIANLPQQATLEAYAEFNLNQLRQFPVEILESSFSTLGGLRAHRVLFAGPLPLPMGPFQGKYLGYLALKGAKSYSATYTSQATKYEKFLPTIEQMLGSLQIS